MSRDPSVTHRIMSSIKSKDTKPELMLRKALWQKGMRYRINYKRLAGKPDIVFTKAKIAIFCDGDFWHGHNWALRGIPSLEDELASYSSFWKEKILNNVARDKRTTQTLEADGWIVLRFWESDIKNKLNECVSVIENTYLIRTKPETTCSCSQCQ